MSNDTLIRFRADDDTRIGVFASGLMVFSGPHEFVLDFIQNMEVPTRVVARITVARPAMGAMLDVIRQVVELPPASSPAANLVTIRSPVREVASAANENPAPPAASGAASAGRPIPISVQIPAQEPRNVYDDIKISDAVRKGVYANSLVTAHNDHLFRMDFVAKFCPDSVLASRVYLTRAEASGIRATLEHVAAGAK